MVEARICDFTGERIEPGTGVMYVETSGAILHFKDSKAEKCYLRGQKPEKTKWTKIAREEKQQRLTNGSEGALGLLQKEKVEPEMNEAVDSVLQLLEAQHPYQKHRNSLRTYGIELARQFSYSNDLQVKEVRSLLGVVPVVPPSDQKAIERVLRSFAKEVPVEPPEDSSKFTWEELRNDVASFLSEKEVFYERLSKDDNKDVDRLRQEHLKIYLGDRLRYI
ncbi:hypothetical protein [Haloferax sp. AB510]|uniref:eL24 family ribosomal protein n=1 Tax=Haloferax sp. AB510 TaxID=2934172 RepID=UPI00211334E2|nr:hypothetical protein [Haloferax sp. AB510]